MLRVAKPNCSMRAITSWRSRSLAEVFMTTIISPLPALPDSRLMVQTRATRAALYPAPCRSILCAATVRRQPVPSDRPAVRFVGPLWPQFPRAPQVHVPDLAGRLLGVVGHHYTDDVVESARQVLFEVAWQRHHGPGLVVRCN